LLHSVSSSTSYQVHPYESTNMSVVFVKPKPILDLISKKLSD